MKSVYDIKIKSWDGQDDFLNNFKGKVCLFINVTGDCGNAPEYEQIEKLYKLYKDKGFEVIAIPTNQFCGKGVTYGEYEDGLSCADEAREFAIDEFDVTYNFTEMVNSKPGEQASEDFMKKYYPGREESFPRQLKNGESPHDIFLELTDQTFNLHKGTEKEMFGNYMFGNFEKYLVDKDGFVIKYYRNGSLMPFIYEKNNLKELGVDSNSVLEEFEKMCKDIESLI